MKESVIVCIWPRTDDLRAARQSVLRVGSTIALHVARHVAQIAPVHAAVDVDDRCAS